MPRSEPRELSTAGVAVALLGLFMAVADFFIVNVSLPSIARTLHADDSALQLVVAGYGMAYAVLLVVGGRLGDTYGRRRLFLGGVAAFTLASALCGAAPTPGLLVAARILQGGAAAAFVPQVLATIHASLSGERRAQALSWYGAALGSAAVVGQLVGGVLVQLDILGLAWRPVFYVNVPIGIVALVLGRRLLPENRSPRPLAPDIAGAALLGAALLALLIPATTGRELGWPAWSLALLPIAPVALVALLLYGRRVERRGGEPLLPASLLALPAMRASVAVVVALFLAAGGFFLTTALSLQDGLGFGPLASGLVMAPFALAFLAASLSGKRLSQLLGTQALVLGGLFYAMGMAGLAAQAWLGYRGESIVTLAPAMILAGAGQGLIVAPLIGIALRGVPAHRAGTASGLLTTVIQACLAVGAAVVGTIFLAILGPGARPGLGAYSHAAATVDVVQGALGLCVAALALRLPSGEAAVEEDDAAAADLAA